MIDTTEIRRVYNPARYSGFEGGVGQNVLDTVQALCGAVERLRGALIAVGVRPYLIDVILSDDKVQENLSE